MQSPDGKPIRVALMDGRVCIIGSEPREVPDDFVRLALSEGAVYVDEDRPVKAKTS
ncbi:MAG: hypothetical protein NZ518_00045 [Dehalococcoidia bacterium]|nr:hypothetical protein [Dehalococcoidia bacterium]